GFLFQDLKRDAEAEAQFRRAMELEPAEPLHPRNLGNLFKDRGRPAEAERWYRRGPENRPRYAGAANRPRRLLPRTERRRGGDAGAGSGSGLLCEARRGAAGAEAQFRQAMELERAEPLYPRNLGDLLKDRGRPGETEQWYRRALEIDPRYAAAFNGLGLLFQ